MMARRLVVGGIAGSIVMMLAACRATGRNRYRFKMSVEVETQGEARVGSSIYEVVTFGSRDLVTGGKGSRFTLRGEAVGVDLPDGATLFALLHTVAQSGRDNVGVSSMVAMDPDFAYDWMTSTLKIGTGDGVRSPADVPPEYYPLFVVFRDANDPFTIERVEPKSIGVTRIVVEKTNDPVTSSIENRLPWLSRSYQILRGKNFKPNGIPVGDFKGLFSTELSQ